MTAGKVATAGYLRRLHVVSVRSRVIHHPHCAHMRRGLRSPLRTLSDDPRYLAGELRAGHCCRPVVPRPNAPDDVEGWRVAL